jgi:hypothetical protein
MGKKELADFFKKKKPKNNLKKKDLYDSWT